MSGRVEGNKLQKEKALLDAAFELFSKIGINETTIDEIVKKAGVAKGTFYLYFKDKYDILDWIVVKNASILLRKAIETVKLREFENRVDKVIFFIGYIIDYLSRDRFLMKIIHKDLSLSLYHKVLGDPSRGKELKEMVREFKTNILSDSFHEEEVNYLLFILIDMTGSICYSAIVNNEPAPIEKIKPVLLKAIGKILV